jgi:hypothetical protein
MLVGCMAEDTRCDEAAAALASCHGIDASAFSQACNAAPAEEANALVDEVLGQSCPAADGKADGLGEWAFIEACLPVMMSASLVNQVRNPSSAPLGDRVKATLRPYFGGLVDKVRVHWNATLPDDWPLLHVKDAFMDVGAQTFGTQIFTAYANTAGSTRMLAHELTHARQAERFGGAPGFYREYCRGFYRSGLSYDRNPLEIEAYAEEARIAAAL